MDLSVFKNSNKCAEASCIDFGRVIAPIVKR